MCLCEQFVVGKNPLPPPPPSIALYFGNSMSFISLFKCAAGSSLRGRLLKCQKSYDGGDFLIARLPLAHRAILNSAADVTAGRVRHLYAEITSFTASFRRPFFSPPYSWKLFLFLLRSLRPAKNNPLGLKAQMCVCKSGCVCMF